MSIEALSWAIRQPVFPSTRKFVLVMLGNFCGDTGLAYPSVKSLAEATGLKDETVMKSLDDLLAEKLIEDTGKKAGETRRIRVFKLPPEAWANTPHFGGIKSSSNTPKNGGIESSVNPPVILRESSVPADRHIEEPEQEPYVYGANAPTTRTRFVPPTIDECLAYGQSLKVTIAGEEHRITADSVRAFFDHFTSNGWKVSGRAAMKDWRAAMGTWARNDVKFKRNDKTYGNTANRTNGGRNLGQVGQRPTVAEQRNAQIIGAELVRAGIRSDQANATPPPWADYK